MSTVEEAEKAVEILHRYVYDAPYLRMLVGKNVRKRLDAKSIVQLIRSLDAPIGTAVYIEQSIPFPKDGKQEERRLYLLLHMEKALRSRHGARPLSQTRLAILPCCEDKFYGRTVIKAYSLGFWDFMEIEGLFYKSRRVD